MGKTNIHFEETFISVLDKPVPLKKEDRNKLFSLHDKSHSEGRQ